MAFLKKTKNTAEIVFFNLSIGTHTIISWDIACGAIELNLNCFNIVPSAHWAKPKDIQRPVELTGMFVFLDRRDMKYPKRNFILNNPRPKITPAHFCCKARILRTVPL